MNLACVLKELQTISALLRAQNEANGIDDGETPEPPPPPEPPGNPAQTIVRFTHNNNGGTSNAGELDNQNCLQRLEDIRFGSGVQWNGSNFEWVLTGIDTNSADAAQAAGDWVDFYFQTSDSARVITLDEFYHGLEPTPNASAAGGYNYDLKLVDVTNGNVDVIATNEFINTPQGARVNKNVFFNDQANPQIDLLPDTEYFIRMCLYNASGGLTGNPGTVSVDDVILTFNCEV